MAPESPPRAHRPPRRSDAPRRAAFDTLRAVAASDAYANLVLPPLLAERGIRGRDAAFATELAYGTLRLRGRYDALLARTSTRPLDQVDPALLDVLRLGTHQILGMRVPSHAALAQTVALAREEAGQGPAGFVNAVLRAVSRRDLGAWLADLRTGPDPLATEYSHPPWVVRALRESLAGNGRDPDELTDLLAADNATPEVTLVARPGLCSTQDLAAEIAAARLPAARPGRWSPLALRMARGDPASLPSIRRAAAGVQDEGSQLVGLAVARAALAVPPRRDRSARWLDLCAGPGGKAALLGAVLATRADDGTLVANEVAAHRVALVRRAVRRLSDVEVRHGDGRRAGDDEPERYDLVLVDAPCTGLGALRRRPESRWRRSPGDIARLAPLQRELLTAAIRATAPGGVIAYVTCSPHLAETHAVADDARRTHPDLEVLDAVTAVRSVAGAPVPHLGDGPYVQLWPHLHGTDAMFLALLRVPADHRAASAT